MVFVELGIGCEERCVEVIFECLELTCASAAIHVCDCGVIWRLMVLGVEQQRAGARVFRGRGRGGGAIFGGRCFDVVVTPCDVRRLEMAPPARIGSLLLLCLG